MSGKREIACGVDVHNKFIVATILSSDGLKLQDRFDTNLEELLNLKFRDWLKENVLGVLLRPAYSGDFSHVSSIASG